MPQTFRESYICNYYLCSCMNAWLAIASLSIYLCYIGTYALIHMRRPTIPYDHHPAANLFFIPSLKRHPRIKSEKKTPVAELKGIF